MTCPRVASFHSNILRDTNLLEVFDFERLGSLLFHSIVISPLEVADYVISLVSLYSSSSFSFKILLDIERHHLMLGQHFDGPSELTEAEPTYSFQFQGIKDYFLVVTTQFDGFGTHSYCSQIVIGFLLFLSLFGRLLHNDSSSIWCIRWKHNLLL